MGLVIEKQNQRIAELEQEVERQKAIRLLDSKTSSKPLSTDILTKSEQKPPELSAGEEEPEKRKPGGQPGHNQF
jgi:transposase